MSSTSQKQSGWSDEDIQILNNTFEVDGYEFVSWNTKADGSGEVIQPNDFKLIQKDITLYAQWKFLYTYMKLNRIGNVTVESNIGKFDTNSGFKTPINFLWNKTDSWEMLLKIKTSDNVGTNSLGEDLAQVIFRLSDTYKTNLCLIGGSLVCEETGAKSTTKLNPNTIYYLKVVKTGNTLNVSVSTDNITFIQTLSTTISTNISNQQLIFGQRYSYTKSEQVVVEKTREVTTYDRSPKWVQMWGWGFWTSKCKPITKEETYNVTETKYTTITTNDFNGEMDFNESYLVLNNIKYKLKA